MASPDDHLIADLIAAHKDTKSHTELLAQARKRRREIATQLHAAGHSYRWIGHQIGLSAQAVEGFVKYHHRRPRKPKENIAR